MYGIYGIVGIHEIAIYPNLHLYSCFFVVYARNARMCRPFFAPVCLSVNYVNP